MKKSDPSVLVIGYGNPGRGDDGMGPALVLALEKLDFEGVTLDADYQLKVEDSELISRYNVVVFADAAMEGREPFSFYRISPKANPGFTTHNLNPEGLLALTEEVFKATPRGYILGIRGYTFDEFSESLSGKGRENLQAALRFIAPVLRARSFEEVLTVEPNA